MLFNLSARREAEKWAHWQIHFQTVFFLYDSDWLRLLDLAAASLGDIYQFLMSDQKVLINFPPQQHTLTLERWVDLSKKAVKTAHQSAAPTAMRMDAQKAPNYTFSVSVTADIHRVMMWNRELIHRIAQTTEIWIFTSLTQWVGELSSDASPRQENTMHNPRIMVGRLDGCSSGLTLASAFFKQFN